MGANRSGRGDRAGTAERIESIMNAEGETVGHHARTVNQLSTYALTQFESTEEMRTAAREIKEHSIERLPALIDQVEQAVAANGGQVHLASSGADANRIVAGILESQDARTLVKSKSMTTEEIEANDYLADRGYEVTETDLGEFVIQMAGEDPSHLIGPAMHKSPEDIADLFNESFDLAGEDRLEANPHELTTFARRKVGEAIRTADVGMTGANFVVAETGTIALVTNEGNARKTAVAPKTHIAVAGVEKLVPTVADLHPFTELIARSGTGQEITSYVSLLTPPVESPIPDFEGDRLVDAEEREFHLILLDNGRMAMREDADLRETLYCIRCGACSNTCANFQAVGGHAFGGETYTGGIGTGWEAGVFGLDSAGDMNDLCTGCSRCVPKCPVKIDIPWVNTVVRERRNRAGEPDAFDFLVDGLTPEVESAGMDRQKRLFGNVERFAQIGSHFPRLSNALLATDGVRWLLERFTGIDSRRALPKLANTTLREWYGSRGPAIGSTEASAEVVLYPDLYTDYFEPERGKAAVRLLEALDRRVHIPEVPESGRAPLSQGMVETAREQAREVHAGLVSHLDEGYDVIVIEPSDLAMFRSEYRRLLPERSFERLAGRSYEVLEYVEQVLEREEYGLAGEAGVDSPPVVYHSHCQQRTLELAEPTVSVLAMAGFSVRTTDVECCGMAGSFGYKQEYFGVSEAVGEHLVGSIDQSDDPIIAASGTSCQEQLRWLAKRDVVHPVELLA